MLDDEAHRQTPQAFSHLTFERSGHQLVVVDIQGVGDLYTDPQIHTASGSIFLPFQQNSHETVFNRFQFDFHLEKDTK